jgi:thioredoxin reductase
VLTGPVLGEHLLSIERIDGYPGFPDGIAGYDLCPMVQEQAVAAGAEFSAAAVTGLAANEGRWTVPSGEGRSAPESSRRDRHDVEGTRDPGRGATAGQGREPLREL